MQMSQTLFQSSSLSMIDVQKAQREGALEAIKEIIKERSKNYHKLNALLSKTQSVVLFRLSTFWPLKLFPVHLEIASDRINLTFWEFIRSGQLVSLTTDIIQEVSVESGPIFSTLKITTNKPMEPIVQVSYLKKDEALKARRIIQGLITANIHEVSLENINADELAEKLEDLGSSKTIEQIIL